MTRLGLTGEDVVSDLIWYGFHKVPTSPDLKACDFSQTRLDMLPIPLIFLLAWVVVSQNYDESKYLKSDF